MSVIAEPPQLPVEEFEAIERTVAAASASVRLEFIDGRIGVKGLPDSEHGEIIAWLRRQCERQRRDLRLYSARHGLTVEEWQCPTGRARPDGSLAPEGYFRGKPDWADASGVFMTVEVTSYDSDTHRRNREVKPGAYAGAGIPVYLLIDRHSRTVVVHSEPDPEAGEYALTQTARFGAKVALPELIGVTLYTAELRGYAH
ncbi:Uma2 family endonuclease [Streptomyces sp. G45]|uniref:Uma2 family endonuclease n=1 Tax=Streptomyces sp. G45 TaxID=3406627 RepID=UPI003C217699